MGARYTFLKKSGQGAQGQVFEAVRNDDQAHVAIKLLRIDSVHNWKCYELFHREADVLSGLSMPGVARFYEAGESLECAKPFAYIVQEFIEGSSLENLLISGYRFTVSEVFELGCQLIRILKQLHSHEPCVIHRDIKPSNILLKSTVDNAFEAYLIDFGAVANPQVQGGGSTVAGTYGYMPPEQLMGNPEPASDTYALAATIIFMLCGVQPGEMRCTDFRTVFEPYLENMPRSVVLTLRKMMEPKIESRLCDCDKIESIFSSFAHEDFILDDDELPVDADFGKKLQEVESYAQSGNLDLWMQLGEKTPRIVPDCYQNFIPAPSFENEFAKVNAKRVNVREAVFHSFLISYLVILPITAVILLIFVLCNRVEFHNAPDGIVAVVMFGVAIPSLYFLKGLASTMLDVLADYLKDGVGLIDALMEYRKDKKRAQSIRSKFEKLIRDGRRSIATVVDFEYIHASVGLGKIVTIQATHKDIESGEKIRAQDKSCYPLPYYSVNTYPKFRLRYRFNPPDDSLREDLIHEIIVHQDYRDKLIPGTPLPILYRIDPESNRFVMSMPFPATLWDAQGESDVICQTENGVILYE